ncbi:MAG: hypothetical protein ILA06_05700 [Bacteroidaceae bacterium]|nr:hypothetical protein [Bacteroidaceae bacterium]
MKPKTFLTIIVMLLALFNSESAQAQRLVIWQKDGSKFSYNLDEEPMTTFTTTNLVITTKTTTISYPLSTIHRYTYEGVPSGVDDATADGISISHDGNDIIVKGLASGKSAAVYSVDGIQLLAKCSDGPDRLVLSLNQLPAAVYVIKADNITYKFTKR